MQQLFKKIKEALFSILPVTLLVVIFNATPLLDFETKEITIFLLSSIFLILGIALFSLGADMAMSPMGEQVGSGLTKTKSMKFVLLVCFILGVCITIAEPDLSVLATQVKNFIAEPVLMVFVGLGVGLFLVFAILKIVFKKNLSEILLFFYLVLFSLASFLVLQQKGDFLALAFDSGGVTTGPITVPFIMALGVGIASVIGGKKSKENSFGLVALCSIGPVLAVLILGLFSQQIKTPDIPNYTLDGNTGQIILREFIVVLKDVTQALGLVVIFFFVLQSLFLKLPKKKLMQIFIGVIYTYLGLVIFLTAVNVGFMPIGYKMGIELAAHQDLLIIFGFILGFVVVLAEPAVQVLNKQVEEITDGMVSKKSMLIALSIGVGISIGLSMLRIVYDFNILYYLVPGYLVSLGLTLFVPRIYTAIAFDSGGVASGPLTSSFILPFAIGACVTLQGEAKIFQDGFGIVAMVAMTPLISIQLLGFKSILERNMKEKIAMRRILDADDEQIIDFM